MKKFISVLATLIITFSLFSGFGFTFSDLTTTADAASGLYVQGTNLFDANGNRLVLRGVNISHAWYSGSTMNNISKARSYGCNAVRIVCADGQRWSKTDYNTLKNIIEKCVENGLICVLEVHDTTDSDSVSSLNTAVNYWKEMKSLLNQYNKYVIVNIANEWMASWDKGKDWQAGYINAVKQLRSAGITNVLMVDGPGYGQEVNAMYQYCRGVRDADTTGNIMFSIHMYADAGKDAATIKSGIDAASQMGICLCIGEFGCAHGTRDVDEYTIMSHCKTRQVSYFAWSWYGNGGNDKQLDLFNDEYGSSMTTWGNTVFNSTYGIKNTSVLAYRTNNWTVDPVIDIAGEKNDADGNNIFLSGKMFIGRQGGAGVTIESAAPVDSKFNHNIIKTTIGTIKSNGGYYSIVLDRESIPTTNTMGVGFWYKTPAGQTVDYNLYFDELSSLPVAIELPATNGEWRYIYIPWDDLGGRPASVSTCKMYYSKIEDKNFAGTIYMSDFAVTNIMDEEGNIATDTSMGGNYTNKPEDTDTETDTDVNIDTDTSTDTPDTNTDTDVNTDTDTTTDTDTDIPAPTTYTITALSANSSMGITSGSGQYKAGDTVTLVAVALDGYKFVNWTYEGMEASNDEVFSFIAGNTDFTFVANFEKLPDVNTDTDVPDTDIDADTYRITALASDNSFGATSGTGDYKSGSTVTLTAVPMDGYEFVNWTYEGFEVSTDQVFSFIVGTTDSTFTANFKKIEVPDTDTDTDEPDDNFLLGDVNDDKVVDIIDVVLMRSHIIGKTPLVDMELVRGDMNKDTNVDIIDVVMARSEIIKG